MTDFYQRVLKPPGYYMRVFTLLDVCLEKNKELER